MKLLLLQQLFLQLLLLMVREGRDMMVLVMMMGRPGESAGFSAGIENRTIVSVSEPIHSKGGATAVVMMEDTPSPRRGGKQRWWWR